MVLVEIDGQCFDWDPTKNLKNISKHGIPFKLAATIFSDQDTIFLDDYRHSQTKIGSLL